MFWICWYKTLKRGKQQCVSDLNVTFSVFAGVMNGKYFAGRYQAHLKEMLLLHEVSLFRIQLNSSHVRLHVFLKVNDPCANDWLALCSTVRSALWAMEDVRAWSLTCQRPHRVVALQQTILPMRSISITSNTIFLYNWPICLIYIIICTSWFYSCTYIKTLSLSWSRIQQ